MLTKTKIALVTAFVLSSGVAALMATAPASAQLFYSNDPAAGDGSEAAGASRLWRRPWDGFRLHPCEPAVAWSRPDCAKAGGLQERRREERFPKERHRQ